MRIEIVVTPDGKSQVETKGFAGSACREASMFIERALGKRIGETLTPEFHQVATVEQQQTEQQGR
jgi:hypothetical protein